MYKNPTDYFMHVVADTSVAARLSEQFASQVSALSPRRDIPSVHVCNPKAVAPKI